MKNSGTQSEKSKSKKVLKFNKKICVLALIALFVIALIVGLILFIGGRIESSSPVGMTEDYLKKYNKLDDSIVMNITYDFSDKVTANQENYYKVIIKRQYERLKYDIVDSYVGEDDATVNVLVTVIDLKSAYEQANSYVESHREKYFDEENNFDLTKAVDYKLAQLESASLVVDYAISFRFYKNELGKWVMQNPSDTDLLKISGIF